MPRPDYRIDHDEPVFSTSVFPLVTTSASSPMIQCILCSIFPEGLSNAQTQNAEVSSWNNDNLNRVVLLLRCAGLVGDVDGMDAGHATIS